MAGRTPDAPTSAASRRAAFGVAGRVAVLLLGLVSVAITTRYLGPTSTGSFALALSFMQLFGVLADAGLTTIVVRELAQRPERAPAVLGSALALRSVLALCAAAAAALVALALPYPPRGPRRGPDRRRPAGARAAQLGASSRCCRPTCGRAGSRSPTSPGARPRSPRWRRGGARPRLLRRGRRRRRGCGGDAGGDLGAGATAAAGRPHAERATMRAAAARGAAARRGARAERGLLPRRRADHLAVAPVRGARPVRARLAGRASSRPRCPRRSSWRRSRCSRATRERGLAHAARRCARRATC